MTTPDLPESTGLPTVTAAGWSPVFESDVPLAWPSRNEFLEWLDRRDKKVAAQAREEERIRADKQAVDWLTGYGKNYAECADRLLPRLRYALAWALSEEGM